MSIDLSTVKTLKRKLIEIQPEELYISTNLDFFQKQRDELKKMEEAGSLFRGGG